MDKSEASEGPQAVLLARIIYEVDEGNSTLENLFFQRKKSCLGWDSNPRLSAL